VHKNKLFYEKTIEIKGKLLGGPEPMVMGIVNLTPDSFFEGSRKQTENEILNTVCKMVQEGVDILDLGAYSSRPNAEHISEEMEWNRLAWVIPTIIKDFPGLILSVDTFRANIAEKSLIAGVDIINDISAGNLDEQMFSVISKYPCTYVMMHMRGTPQTMQSLINYENLLGEMNTYFEEKINTLNSLGVHNIIIDPGFGFAKNIPQNFELLSRCNELLSLKQPLLIGISRKSMIYKTLSVGPEDALNGTTALNMIALERGANILRVHDVKEAKECIKLWRQLNK
jgi:dihydropteroate synthase